MILGAVEVGSGATGIVHVLVVVEVDILTFRATFLSLFMALNCFILVKTAISMGLSDAPSSFIHG